MTLKLAYLLLAALILCSCSPGENSSQEARLSNLIGQLRNPDAEARDPIPLKIAGIGNAAIPSLINALKADDWSVRDGAIKSLVLLGARESIPKIRPLLKDPNAVVRICALGAMAAFRATEMAPDIRNLLDDRRSIVRAWAGIALIEFGETKDIGNAIVEDIKAVLSLKSKPKRDRAIRALRSLGIPDEEIEDANDRATALREMREFEDEIQADEFRRMLEEKTRK